MRKVIAIGALFLLCQGVFAMETVKGEFKVKMDPKDDSPYDNVTLGRMLLDKTFTGGLSGKSRGQMLTAVSKVPSSAVYVAIERFEGSLNNLEGSFAMSHRGIMSGGEQNLVIEIVPDSGSGELTGIQGSMKIDITDGKHFYVLDYELNP